MARGSSASARLVVLLAGCMALRLAQHAFVLPGLSRRGAFQAAAGAAATVGAQAAWADAQGEPTMAFGKYGPTILGLKSAVDSGDLKAVLKREQKFKLLNSYWRNSPDDFQKVTSLTEALLDAADAGKASEVQKLYTEYTSLPEFDILKNYPPPKGKALSMNAYGRNEFESDPVKTADKGFFKVGDVGPPKM
eukprot:gb/GFBE01023234.1/.p1 GENE.gb/GFBE01023234.1/~~gb/GFBE01023234.1/.p1  ORF type:complete len:192 (+),score=57.01 gb/GFBE01023234.1/:1-576(+)